MFSIMMSFNIRKLHNYCSTKENKWHSKPTRKVATHLALIEIISSVTAIVLAHLISINSLPSSLYFLKGCTQLVIPMGVTGICLLTFTSLCSIKFIS